MPAEHYSIADVTHRPGVHYARHTHDRTYLSFVLAGDFEEHVGRSAEIAVASSVVVMPAGVEHTDRIGSSGHRSLLVTLEHSFAEQMDCALRQWRVVFGGQAARTMLRLRRAFIEQPRQNDMIEDLLLEAVDGLSETRSAADTRTPACVRTALNILKDDQARRPTLRSIAAEARVDPSYLARSFRRVRGVTLGEYQRSLRARRAAALLSSGEMALSEIALAAGFADHSHLCRVFKFEFGCSPGEYRRLAAA